MYLKYSKLKDDVMDPTRANPSDAGLDVYHYSDVDITVSPGESVILKTGLKFEVPHGYMLQVCNRGGMGAKKSLVFGAHIIDSGYDGPVFINLHNIGTTKQVICGGDKIAQLILTPVVSFIPILCDEKELYDEDVSMSNRGDGSLGSTGQ